MYLTTGHSRFGGRAQTPYTCTTARITLDLFLKVQGILILTYYFIMSSIVI
jgi:hypothetical protein